jgi:choline dehydrogenase-like flavoprotein
MQRRVIVVGAGSAGCVMAARLSEDPSIHVTVLEAGPDVRSDDEPPEITGASFLSARKHTHRFWPDLLATRGDGLEPLLYERGRGVGGSSAVNGMVALAGETDDYDDWERLYDCVGWGWRDVEPWFRRTSLILNRAPRREWGRMNLALSAVHPEAMRGVPLTRNVAGRRVSSNDAYLEPARGRENLVVRGDAQVDRLLFDSSRRFRALRLVGGEELEADAVVLSAGAFHTPAILLRSGADVPGIGDNLHDHPAFPIAIARTEPADLDGLNVATVVQATSSWATRNDLQLVPLEYVDPSMPDLGMIFAGLMKSWSRGRVTLQSDDPTVHPRIDFNLLSDERDWILMERAIDLAERALEHPAIRSMGAAVPYDRSEASLRDNLHGFVHAGGTCAMGTVLEPDGRLRTYRGVIVCDASVWPEAPRANAHLPVTMIAERVSFMTRQRFAEGDLATAV